MPKPASEPATLRALVVDSSPAQVLFGEPSAASMNSRRPAFSEEDEVRFAGELLHKGGSSERSESTQSSMNVFLMRTRSCTQLLNKCNWRSVPKPKLSHFKPG